jgi:predicted alpha/beta hydrolase family esterase
VPPSNPDRDDPDQDDPDQDDRDHDDADGDAADGDAADQDGTPLDQLGVLAMQTVAIDEELEHLEIYTSQGLLSLLWHGAADLENAVVCVGGAMGGMLGPDGGLFHQLGRVLPSMGIGLVRVSYRQPNDLPMCVHDTVATMELLARHGARRFITMGHSFGGAVAIQAAAHLDRPSVPGIVTFATQSAGCEVAERLGDRNLLLFHGTNDQILPAQASEMVRFLAETGELVLLPGADHLLHPAGEEIRTRLESHLPEVFAACAAEFG